MDDTAGQLSGIGVWRDGMKAAIETWRSLTVADERDPALSAMAADLENLVAFEERALDVASRLRNAKGDDETANPFAGVDGDALAADLRALEADQPDHAVMLPALRQASRELDDHETAVAWNEERQRAAAAIARGLDAWRACHQPMDDSARQLSVISAWCGETKAAIEAWQFMTAAGEMDPALSEMAAILEGIVAFEERALDLAVRLGNARGDDRTANPFAGVAGETLAADLRALEADVPDHAVMLSVLRQASRELDDHETALARNEKRQRAAAAVASALDDYAARHAHVGERSREQARSLSAWCAETRGAIDTWRVLTEAEMRDPALAAMAADLENLIAFEGRAGDVLNQWNGAVLARLAGALASPFLTPEGETLARDLKALEAALPRHGVLLPDLRQALADLDAHETAVARNEERQRAAAAVAGALEDYAACHERIRERLLEQVEELSAWCDGTTEAIGTWRNLTETDGRDPALSAMAADLENLVAFEERALDLRVRWNDASRAVITHATMRPFLTPGGDALARDLRALEAGLPRHGVLLPSLRRALGALGRHEAWIAERDQAAARIERALDDYRACHAPARETAGQLSQIGNWCREIREALDTLRAATDPGQADPLLSNRAAILDDLIAFEERAFDVARAWLTTRRAIRQTNPFLGPEGEALAAKLTALQAGSPLHAMMPQVLKPALERLAEHERAHARTSELIARAREVDGVRRSLLQREGKKSRPLNRRFNRDWTRWRDAAAPVAADIDATDNTLLAHLDKTGVARRVRNECAASGRLDHLPGWLLLRLHDNAVRAGSAVHPAMTDDYAGIVSEMQRLDAGLRENDPRRVALRGEINRYQDLMQTRRKVDQLLADLKAHDGDTALLRARARREDLTLQQSLAWDVWYDESRRLEGQARAILSGGDRDTRVVLHDGQGTAQAFEEAIARFEETRKAHGKPDDSVRLERERQEAEKRRQAWSQSRGRSRGFSM